MGWLVRKLCICHGGVKGILRSRADIAFIRVRYLLLLIKRGVVCSAELCLGWVDTPRGGCTAHLRAVNCRALVYEPRYGTPGYDEESQAERAIGQEGMRFASIDEFDEYAVILS